MACRWEGTSSGNGCVNKAVELVSCDAVIRVHVVWNQLTYITNKNNDPYLLNNSYWAPLRIPQPIILLRPFSTHAY